MTTHYLKQGDTLPILTANFSGAIAPGSVVTFRMRLHTAAEGVYKVNAPAVIEDEMTGEVSYTFTAQDTDTCGIYFAEFVVTLGLSVQTIPTANYNLVEVIPHL